MKRLILFGLAAVVAFAAAACGSETQSDHTSATSTERLLVTAQSGNESASAASLLRERLGAGEHVVLSFSNESETETAQIDADVLIPDATKLSIIEVSRSKLTQELADRIVNALVQGQLVAYDQQNERLYGSDRVKQHIEALDTLITQAGGSKSAEWKANMQVERDYWAEVLANATEHAAPISSRLTHPSWADAEAGTGYIVYDDSFLQILGMAESEAGCETLSIRKGNDESVVVCYVREPNECVNPGAQIGSYKSEDELLFKEKQYEDNPYGDICLADVGSIPSISTTQEQALETGNRLMNELGITNVSFVAAEQCWGGSFDSDAGRLRGMTTAGYGITNPFRCVWRLRYTRTINGLSTTYDRIQCQPYIDPEDDKEVLPSADYESIEVYIDDTGIVGFRWAAPQDIGAVAVEDAAVLSFDEIMKVFSGTFLVANEWSNPSRPILFRITQIRFGYTRVRDADVCDKGLLIPAWDFYGEMIYDPNGDQTEYRSLYNESMFTINAIDGSIIDRQQGY